MTTSARASVPGWRTSEFWFSFLTSAWAMFGHALPPVVQGVVVAAASGAYAISRAIVKAAPPLVAAPVEIARLP